MKGILGLIGTTPANELEGEEKDLLTLGAKEEEMTAGIEPKSRQVGKRCASSRFFLMQYYFAERDAQMTMTASQTDEEKKAERLAKLEAWKQKQAAEKDRKQKELESSRGTRNLLAEIDKKAQGSPAVASPVSPSTPAGTGDASPVPYAGKFDPKALSKKKASTSSGASKLGTDIALPEIAKASATMKPNANGLKADKTVALANGSSGTFFSTS